MKKIFAFLVFTLSSLFVLASNSHAITIGLDPAASSASPGDIVLVDVVVSDLAGEIVSAYDLDMSYDSSVLTASSISLTSALGDGSFFEAFYDSDLSTPGLVDLAGLSLLSDASLLALQGGISVVLATVSFTAIGIGDSSLDFVFDAFNDIKGSNNQVLDVTPVSGSIGVSSPIPEPATLALLGLGLAGLGWSKRKKA